MTLSLTINETLKWLSSLPILMQESVWWLHRSDRYNLPLPRPPYPLPHFSSSLISLMVSVAVQHQVYFCGLTRAQELCESPGGRPGLPVPNKPYAFCGRKAPSKKEVVLQTLGTTVEESA